MTVYDVTLRVLSPVFIGDGNDLRSGADFATRNGKTYRFNQDKILEEIWESLEADNRKDNKWYYLDQYLKPEDYNNPELFRYVIPGVPRSSKGYAELKACIKDMYDRPYIPGSSLKGALRTALAWTGWEEAGMRFDLSRLGRNRSWAGQSLERELFGRDPNHDLLRALQVSDLHGPQKPGEGLVIANAQVYTSKSQQSPIEVEAIVGNTDFTGTIKIDDALFSDWASHELRHFKGRKPWLNQLVQRTQQHSAARIKELAQRFEYVEKGEAVKAFYRKLAAASVGKNSALMQIGWGAGWDGKTFYTHLSQDPRQFEQLIDNFRLQRRAPKSPPRKQGDRFPASRRVAVQGERAVAPFGWVLMNLKERK